MAADIEMQEITRLLTTELRPKVDAVRATGAWTREGKRARRQLKQFLAELRGLAQASGQPARLMGSKRSGCLFWATWCDRKNCRTGTVLAASIKGAEICIGLT